VVSPTGMEKFLTCPRMYALQREMKPKEISDWFVLGNDVHAIMEGRGVEEPHPKALDLAMRLKALDRKYQPIERELTQRIRLKIRSNIVLHRRIDMLAVDGAGIPAVVDYKTGSRRWQEKEGKVPKACGLQAVAYTMPTKVEKAWDIRAWPNRIDFLVATLDGTTEKHSYHLRPQDVEELVEVADMVRMAAKLGTFPRHVGFSCGFCDFAKACFERPGWEDSYVIRGLEEENDATSS